MNKPGIVDRWTTTWELVVAAAQVVRRHRRLLWFPALVSLAATLSYVGALAPILIHNWVSGEFVLRHGHLLLSPWTALLWSIALWYGVCVVLTFLAVALTSAALQALRAGEVSIPRAFRFAFRRPISIFGFALLTASFGAPLGTLERHSRWALRASTAIFGFSWTLVSIFALTTIAGERLGVAAALRRSVLLLRARWAEGRLSTLGLGLLWLPLLALEGALIWWTQREGRLDLVLPFVQTAALANVLVWAVIWLLERIYATALYCYAVEGVVPEAFANEGTYDHWCVTAQEPDPAEVAGIARPTLTIRQPGPPRQPRGNLGIWAGAAFSMLLSLGMTVWQVRRSGLLHDLFPPPGMKVDGVNFPPGPTAIGSHTFHMRGTLTGITAIHTLTGPQILVFGDTQLVRLGPDLHVLNVKRLAAVAGSLKRVEVLELGPGRGVVVGVNSPSINRNRSAVTAFDWEGNLLFQRTTDEGDATDAIAPIKVGGGWGVAVGYNGSYGLCLLGSHGEEKWCNRDVGNVWVVSSIDCDGDGREEILSLPGRFGGRDQLACYDLQGRQISSLSVPFSPYSMRAVDLHGDGRKEIAYFHHTMNDTHHFGACSADGQPLVDVHADDGGEIGEEQVIAGYRVSKHSRWLTRAVPIAARRGPGQSDIVVIGPDGRLLGVSPSGTRWQAGKDNEIAVAIDLDGDGTDEVVSLSKMAWNNREGTQNIKVWSWKPPGGVPTFYDTRWELPKPTPGQYAPAAQTAIRPYAVPPGPGYASDEELAFRDGCYQGVGVALRALPALVQRDRVADHLEGCERSLARADVSVYTEGSDLAWPGCRIGVSLVQSSYSVDLDFEAVAKTCWAQVHPSAADLAAANRAAPTEFSADASIKPVLLPRYTAARLRLNRDGRPAGDLRLPPKNAASGHGYGAAFDVCVSVTGSLVSAKVKYGSDDDDLDAIWLDQIKASHFRPYVVYDTAIPFCASLSYFDRIDFHKPVASATGKAN